MSKIPPKSKSFSCPHIQKSHFNRYIDAKIEKNANTNLMTAITCGRIERSKGDFGIILLFQLNIYILLV